MVSPLSLSLSLTAMEIGNFIRAKSGHVDQLSSCFALFLKILLLVLMIITMPGKSQANIIYPNTTLAANSSSSVWTSPNGAFSMGFFSFLPGSYYVGIWYASLPSSNQSIIWTANRNESVPANSTLRFTLDGRLQLTTPPSNNATVTTIWKAVPPFSSNAVTNASQAEMLDSGNFVLRGNASQVLWQSFDHPTDTLLPSQNFSFSSNPSLVPWSSTTDPSPSSQYSLVFGRTAGPFGRIRMLYQSTDEYWSEPPPPEVKAALFNTTLSIDATGTISFYNGDGSLIWVNTSCDYGIPNSLTKLQLSVDGNLRVLTWSTTSGAWETQWRALYLQCDVFGTCGENGVCDKNQNTVSAGGGECPLPEVQIEQTLCSCPQGFTRNSSHCSPPSSLNCSQYLAPMEHTSFGVPGTIADYDPLTQKNCTDRCLNDCNCTAASYDNSSSGCWLYYSGLFNGLRYDQINITSFIKSIDINATSGGNDNNLPSYAIALIVVAIFLILLLIFAGLFIRHQIRLRYPTFKEVFLDPDVLGGPKRFSFNDLYMVTRGFHEDNKLGAGGFGSVYKGSFTTPNGKLDVAVKRLDKFQRQAGLEMSSDGKEEGFLAEIEILGSIKHVNVVSLIGFCAEGPERLLVCEYVANGSLSNHILQETSILSWDVRFQIAVGAASGIEYLHTHCPKKIVHRDIKPDNILLDEEFKAKVADFGVSQIMDPEKNRLTINTIRGTPTYMAPECWKVGTSMLTEKADAYSYGLVLLELVSGRMVTKQHIEHREEEEEEEEEEETREAGGGGELLRHTEHEIESQEQGNMINYVRRKRRRIPLEQALQVMEGERWERLVDERMEGEYEREEAERLVKVVFWCLQGNPEQRPSMEDLLLMIKGHKAVDQPPLQGLFDHFAFLGATASQRFESGSASSQVSHIPTELFVSEGR